MTRRKPNSKLPWSSIPTLPLQRAQFEHAIAVLIGKPPAAFNLPAEPLNLSPPDISSGLPSQLLERRPDIAAAERRVAEANDQIGIARAAYGPNPSCRKPRTCADADRKIPLRIEVQEYYLNKSVTPCCMWDARPVGSRGDHETRSAATEGQTALDFHSFSRGARRDEPEIHKPLTFQSLACNSCLG